MEHLLAEMRNVAAEMVIQRGGRRATADQGGEELSFQGIHVVVVVMHC